MHAELPDGPNAAALPHPNIFFLKLTDSSKQPHSTLVSSISGSKSNEMGKQDFTFVVQKTLWNRVDADSLLLSGQADLFTDLRFPGYL